MIRMQVQLTAHQLAAVREISEDQGVSQAEVVRRALDDYLTRAGLDRRVARERARRLIGAFSSDVTDVAERHDHYFAEAIMSGSDADENDG